MYRNREQTWKVCFDRALTWLDLCFSPVKFSEKMFGRVMLGVKTIRCYISLGIQSPSENGNGA